MVSSSTSAVLASLPLLALAAVFLVVSNSQQAIGSFSQCLTPVKLWCVTGKDQVETCSFNHCINVRVAVLMNVALSALCYVGCIRLIPRMRKYMIKAGLSGKDLNKHGAKEDKPDVPEALGLIPGVIYLIAIIFCQLLFGTGGNRAILVEYNAALHSIGFMIFLGFVDDVVDLPWRYKLIIPAVASLPLLVAYGGGTSIIIPLPFRFLLGKTIDLGILYQLYMLLLSIFCTNSINIFAGINGLEAGQSFVIAVAVAIHNILELSGPASPSSNAHLFSLLLILPFIAVTLGLLKYNWYPSEVFVGDTFTTFAGMTFAVVGILGHFSKTLLLFFIPQLINFLYSLPQILHLFGLTCPRHRLPKFNQQTGKLEGVRSHHNLVNLFLLLSGPLREDHLCIALMFFQATCCCIGFAVRYKIANYFY